MYNLKSRRLKVKKHNYIILHIYILYYIYIYIYIYQLMVNAKQLLVSSSNRPSSGCTSNEKSWWLYNIQCDFYLMRSLSSYHILYNQVNPLNPELNPICYLLAILGAHHFLHVSRIRVKLLTFRLLMSYIYIYIYIWSTYSWCF